MIRRRFYQQDKKYDKGNYLTIEALVNNFTFTFTQELEYNVNGDGWKTLAANEELPSMRQGDFISLRANLRPTDSMGIGFFSINSAKKCKLSGNCMSLLFGDNAYTKSSLKGYGRAFYYLFDDCSGIVEVSSNFLPATTLGYECYRGMFNHCLSLVKAPDLPATTLESGCYSAMFDFCTSLAKAPDLPATTLVRTCYYDMFSGCVNLNYIKMLATDISAESCLYDWVRGVSLTGTFVKSKDATWDVVGDSGVPTGWTVITDDQENEGGEITFYLDDSNDVPYEMKAASGMTWEQWVNSNFAPTEGVLRDFRIYKLGSYDMIQLYHELADYEMIVYDDINRYGYATGPEQIENGKTYYIY